MITLGLKGGILSVHFVTHKDGLRTKSLYKGCYNTDTLTDSLSTNYYSTYQVFVASFVSNVLDVLQC